MMMIVSGPVLVTGGGACGLYAAEKPFFYKQPYCVVNRLPGYGAEFRPHLAGDLVRRRMRADGNRTQHGKALRRNRKAVLPKEF